jgi:hypothetical protein
MKKFEKLKELYDYIPCCIVCGKSMILAIFGLIEKSYKEDTGLKRERFSLLMDLKEDKFVSRKHPKYSLVVDAATNNIIEGRSIIGKAQNIQVAIQCNTCCYKLTAEETLTCRRGEYFLPFVLRNIELRYTMKKGKPVHIWGTYYFSDHLNIQINNRTLKGFPLNFSKLHNLAQLNNKLSMMMTFQ